jgi:serine/threonine-protein kinase
VPDESSLWLERARRIDPVCDRFEAAWQTGSPPRIEDFLEGWQGADRLALLRELVLLDLHFRRAAGEGCRTDDYLPRFPDLDPAWLAEALAAPSAVNTRLAPDSGAPVPPEPVTATVEALERTAMGGAGPDCISFRGNYELLDEVARGGMGVVLRARDPAFGRLLAVKVLLPLHRGEPELERRFLAEARLTGRLQHPGIPPAHELGRLADGRPFFAMKLVQGQTLEALLARRDSPADGLPRLLELFAAVCQAVAYAHSQGVIHRDLKPSNVMVGAFGEVQVMDWGLAKVLGTPEEEALSGRGANTTVTSRASAETVEGALLGTPAYMAPEQARGEVGRLDERADVFGLGAILCQILSGEPPYRGTGQKALQQAAKGDLVEAFAHLDACGADAELIRLAKTCLSPDRDSRPRDGRAVAEAVAAYQAGVQERLRAAELETARVTARAAAERKTRRRTVVMAAALLLLVLGGSGAGLWWYEHRAEQARARDAQTRAVRADLAEVIGLLREGKLAEAHTVLVRAEGRVGGGGPAPLLAEVQRLRDDLSVGEALDRIRLRKATIVDGRFDDASAERDYAALFREHGLEEEGENPGLVAERIKGSPIQAQLVAALDDRAIATKNRDRRIWLLEVARLADPGVRSDRFRDPVVWGQRETLERLAREANVAELSPQLLSALGLALQASEADPVPLWKAAQERHPADFWLNFHLANALRELEPEAAVGYYRAALAARPHTNAVHNNLGNVLKATGGVDEAIRHYRQATDIDPGYAKAHYNLGNALKAKDEVGEAIQHLRKSIELDPGFAPAHYNLGNLLYAKGEVETALRHYRQAIVLDPRDATAHYNLGTVLRARGEVPAAIQHYRQAIEIDPRFVKAHINLGNALKATGKVDEAIQHYRLAICLDPRSAQSWTNLGNTLFDLSRTNLGNPLFDLRRLDDAIQHFRQAIFLDSRSAKAHAGLGVALDIKGEVDEAIQHYSLAISLDPGLAEITLALGQAHLKQGRFAKAREATRHFLDLQPPTHRLYKLATQQLRQCERFLELDDKLSAILQNKAKPTNAAERLELAQLCQEHKKLYAAAVRFYTEAFNEQPRLAGDLRAGHRYNAACAAALAASSQGRDADHLTDPERARLRGRALVWLHADLAAWTGVVNTGTAQARAMVQSKLRHWQKDPDLASVRDQGAMAELPEAERAAWGKFWVEVEALLQRAGPAG